MDGVVAEGVAVLDEAALTGEALPVRRQAGPGCSARVCECERCLRPDGLALHCSCAQNNLLAPSRVGAPRGPRNHDGTIIPDTVDTMWGTDLTTTYTGEGQVAVFVAVDHYSAECVGIHAARRATRFEALEPIRQGVRRCFGGFAQGIGRGLAVRHDHGSPYVSDASWLGPIPRRPLTRMAFSMT